MRWMRSAALLMVFAAAPCVAMTAALTPAPISIAVEAAGQNPPRTEIAGDPASPMTLADALAPATVKQPPVVRIIQGPGTTVTDDCPSLPDAQVRNMTCSDAAALIAKLKEAQTSLKNGDQLYFDLLSGGLASDAMTKVSPRESFIGLPFERAFIVERVRTDNRLWQPYKFSYRPPGASQMIWDVEVALGFNEQIRRVLMRYGPPPPF